MPKKPTPLITVDEDTLFAWIIIATVIGFLVCKFT